MFSGRPSDRSERLGERVYLNRKQGAYGTPDVTGLPGLVSTHPMWRWEGALKIRAGEALRQVVSYYDSRCAARVADELGSRCTWETPGRAQPGQGPGLTKGFVQLHGF